MKKEMIRQPLELLFLLSDRCMSLLSSNAWKVVCVVARETIGVYNAGVITGNDPVQLLNRDLRSVGVPIEDVAAAVRDAIARGAVGIDAIKHLVLCRIERRPPRLDMTIYPYLPKATVATTSTHAYMDLLEGAAA